MAENTQRSRGRASNYRFDRGGNPTDFGPFVGVVKNNIDPARGGRLQVYIEQFGGDDENNSQLWRTVSYCPPFYGATPKSGTGTGTGGYVPGNQQSYGMWFTPPDIGVQVMCFFIGGDPNQGYYVGCIPEQGLNHMIPAIGSVENYTAQNATQSTYFASATRMPVTEINNAPENTEITESPQSFKKDKPIHSYVAAVMFQQGLSTDTIRGPIASSAQRESPSACYGFSTPGRAIYQGGLDEATIKQQVESGGVKAGDVSVIGRRGGHTFVMDDGDLEGKDNLIRIRTAKGHQITMSDDGNCFYICHANGQTWVELGEEGTLDVYATNSINLRTSGTLNFHADQDINMFAGKKINIKSTQDFTLQSEGQLNLASQDQVTLYSQANIGIKADGSLGLVSPGGGGWNGGGSLSLTGDAIDLNGGTRPTVATPQGLTIYTMPDTKFNNSSGWEVTPDSLESIVTRAPTHEPYPYHNKGVSVDVKLEEGQPSPPPSSPPVPSGWSITKQ